MLVSRRRNRVPRGCAHRLVLLGARAAHLLGQGLGSGFRVIMIDRNRCVVVRMAAPIVLLTRSC